MLVATQYIFWKIQLSPATWSRNLHILRPKIKFLDFTQLLIIIQWSVLRVAAVHPGTHTCIKLWVSGWRLWVPDPHLKVHLCCKETELGPLKKKLYGTYTIFVKKYSGVSTGSQTPMVFKKPSILTKAFDTIQLFGLVRTKFFYCVNSTIPK